MIIKLVKFVAGMRFFVLIPIIGLAVAADILFIRGELILFISSGNWSLELKEQDTQGGIIVHLVDTVHFSLVGTILSLTSLGFMNCLFNHFLYLHG